MKLNSSQELFQSGMRIVSGNTHPGLKSGEEPSTNASLRARHIKEILSWHTKCSFSAF